MLLGEIERDRERLQQHETAVDDRRQPAVGIDREKFRLARAGVADLDRQMLVVEPELLRDPERAEGAGAGDAVDAADSCAPDWRSILDNRARRANRLSRHRRRNVMASQAASCC